MEKSVRRGIRVLVLEKVDQNITRDEVKKLLWKLEVRKTAGLVGVASQYPRLGRNVYGELPSSKCINRGKTREKAIHRNVGRTEV